MNLGHVKPGEILALFVGDGDGGLLLGGSYDFEVGNLSGIVTATMKKDGTRLIIPYYSIIYITFKPKDPA